MLNFNLFSHEQIPPHIRQYYIVSCSASGRVAGVIYPNGLPERGWRRETCVPASRWSADALFLVHISSCLPLDGLSPKWSVHRCDGLAPLYGHRAGKGKSHGEGNEK